MDGINPDPTRISGPLKIEQRAIRRARPRQELPAAPRGLAPPAQPLGKQGARIRRDGSAHLPQPLIGWGITPGALAAFDPTATRGACIDHEPLRHRVTGETIRCGNENTVKGGQSGPISEAIEPGAVAFGPAIPVITGDGLGGHRPIGGRRHVIAQTTAWRCNRLGLVLTSR